jgi:ABC-type multidrug transport system fused ATPase/permease subunit
MRKLISQSFTTFASASMGMLFSVALMIYYDWRLALLVTLVSLLFGLVAYMVGRRSTTTCNRWNTPAGSRAPSCSSWDRSPSCVSPGPNARRSCSGSPLIATASPSA